MKLYTIYDPESDLYLARGLHRTLDKLSSRTEFFSTKAEAMRVIENRNPLCPEDTILQNDLAWWLLEKVYETDRWHINEVGRQELKDACSQFKKLKVQCLVIGKMDD